MASIKIISNTISRRINDHECIVSSDGIMKFHSYHKDRHLFAFAHIIFAKEISTIFLPEIFGWKWNFHKQLDESEFSDIDEMDIFNKEAMESVLFGMFPGYTKIRHGPHELNIAIDAYKTTLATRVHTLASVFPPLVLAKIAKHHVPTWVSAKHVPTYLEKTDCRDDFFWFMNDSLVRLKIDVV